MLRSLFLFGGKVLKAKGEDLESNKSMSLEDVFITSSLQKYSRVKKTSKKSPKKSPKKKIKIGPIEPLAFSKVSRKKGKVAIIAKANKKVVAKKL